MNLLRGQAPVGQDVDNGAAAHRLERHVPRQGGNAHRAARGAKQSQETVRAKRSCHRLGQGLPIGADEVPACIALHSAVDQGIVGAQFSGHLRRAALGQILGRCDDEPGVDSQKACTRLRVGKPSRPDRDVDALLDEIDVTIFEAQLHVQLEVEPHELHHQRAQAALDLGLHQGGNALGLLVVVGEELALLVVQQADLCRRDALRRAMQQPRAQRLFQLPPVLVAAGWPTPRSRSALLKEPRSTTRMSRRMAWMRSISEAKRGAPPRPCQAGIHVMPSHVLLQFELHLYDAFHQCATLWRQRWQR